MQRKTALKANYTSNPSESKSQLSELKYHPSVQSAAGSWASAVAGSSHTKELNLSIGTLDYVGFISGDAAL